MGAVGLFFAPLAPLVVVASAIIFWISSWVYKYQLMFVFVSKTESGGVSKRIRCGVLSFRLTTLIQRMWNVVINRLLVATILGQCIMILTVGLQYSFKSLYWLATIPPVLFIIIFKMYIHRFLQPSFNYYMPSQEELREAQVHSRRHDASRNRLEKRFGHPALHSDLFTPMVHANMTNLLSQVYSGKVSNSHTKLDEMGGQSTNAVVAGGIKIAGIQEVRGSDSFVFGVFEG